MSTSLQQELFDEAYRLLSLVNMEFQSDPMSVQCFDLRIVADIKRWVESVKREKGMTA